MISDGRENWTTYADLPALRHIYLEDSYVIGIKERGDVIEFKMEFVLMKSHPLYANPENGENYCYKEGLLIFPNVQKVEFVRTLAKYSDPDGSVDFGNIDVFFKDKNRYALEGDWGRLAVECGEPTVSYT